LIREGENTPKFSCFLVASDNYNPHKKTLASKNKNTITI
jgi:hypothetical protein